MSKEKQYIFDKPQNVWRLLWLLYLICALLLVTDLVYHRHTVHDWESLWGFYGLYGFVACITLVLTAKWLRRILKRPEGYYDD